MATSANTNQDVRNPANYGTFIANTYPDIEAAPVYDLMNGDPQRIQPYLARSSIPAWAKWVPIANLPCSQAFATIDASIRSHVYHVMENKPADWSVDKAVKAGVVLGVARAAMFGLYKTTTDLVSAEEMADPVLRWTVVTEATVDQPAEYGLQVLVPVTAPVTAAEGQTLQAGPQVDSNVPPAEGNRAILTGAWALPADFRALMNIIFKAGMTVLPLQGHNLMLEGHHYISERRRVSFKAFKAVETQVFVTEAAKELLTADEDFGRDLLWHKSGHPVNVSYKIAIATSDNVRASLAQLDLGSASVRLPACESELKGLGAYKRLAEAVKPAIEGHDGVVECSVFQEVVEALTAFPVRVPGVGPPDQREIHVGGYFDPAGNKVGTTALRSRADVISYAKALMVRNQHTVARMFGFYVSMLESTQGDTFGGRKDSLAEAKSLDKLKSECLAMFGEGRELHRDMMAMRAKARREGTFKAPTFVIS